MAIEMAPICGLLGQLLRLGMALTHAIKVLSRLSKQMCHQSPVPISSSYDNQSL